MMAGGESATHGVCDGLLTGTAKAAPYGYTAEAAGYGV